MRKKTKKFRLQKFERCDAGMGPVGAVTAGGLAILGKTWDGILDDQMIR